MRYIVVMDHISMNLDEPYKFIVIPFNPCKHAWIPEHLTHESPASAQAEADMLNLMEECHA